jgi:hypothetical protein
MGENHRTEVTEVTEGEIGVSGRRLFVNTVASVRELLGQGKPLHRATEGWIPERPAPGPPG